MAGRRRADVPAPAAVLVRRLPGTLAHRRDERVPRPGHPLRALSAFDLHSVGIGPSSIEAVGPIRAARRFVRLLDDEGRSRSSRPGSSSGRAGP
ncbi:serine dehydratase beta chain [Streptomyces sp. NPDC002888]|uniref:serine dehydratase beta chain n=1 Tax=Streptomyces sp. NPDC002888 TaxID=3364668 RepID=UPI0036A4ADB5